MRQYSLPVAGSREFTDFSVQTISCFFPAAFTTIGELNVATSSTAFHTSRPECLSRASTHGPGGPPSSTSISRLPSIRRDRVHAESLDLLSRFFCQSGNPFRASKQRRHPRAPSV